MGVTVDKVIVELEGRVDAYTQRVNAAERNFTRSMGTTQRSASGMEASVKSSSAGAANAFSQAERRITASSDNIRKSLLATASVLATAFAADKVADYADGYTRFTNQLKLANLSGATLAKTQNDLYGVAQRYGVQLESIGQLYGRVAQAGDSLNASQADLLKFSNGVGAALKIQGGSAEAAQGALLQLSQLLGTGTVRAEEFNSVNEGARPILQAVASGIEKYGGSVAKLRNDVIAGNVSSQQFFDGFLKGSAQLESRAAKANFTVAASIQILNNALGKYIGEADAGLSATQKFSQGIQGLANNLDTIIPALTALGVAYGANLAGNFLKSKQGAIDLAAAVLQGNAVLLNSTKAVELKATAQAQASQIEAAAIRSTITALREEAVQYEANLALLEAQRTAALAAQAQARVNAAAGLGGLVVGAGNASKLTGGTAQADANATLKAQVVTSNALKAATTELAAAEAALAVAEARVVTTTTAQTAAMAANTVAARAGALAMGLFNGAMNLLGGPVMAGALLAVGAVTASIISYRNETAEARERQKDFNASQEEASDLLARTAQYGRSAAQAVKGVGDNAKAGASNMLQFAGAVGQAADALHRLAEENRKAAIEDLRRQETAARSRATAASADFQASQQSGSSVARFGYLPGNDERDKANMAVYEAATAQADKLKAERERISKLDLEKFVPAGTSTVENIQKDLAAAQQQLKVAQAAQNKSAINELNEQVTTLKLTTKYMKDGLGYEAARAAATKDAGDIRAAADQTLARREGVAATRRTTAAERQAEAVRIKGVNADKAFDGDLRQAQNDLLAAQIEAAGSVQQRLDLENKRTNLAADQLNKEIAANGPASSGGTGKYSQAEVDQLQLLNEQTATRRIENARLQAAAEIAAGALALKEADLTNQGEMLDLAHGLARTLSERRSIELRLLDLQTQEERMRLQAVTIANGATETEAEIARRRLAMLDEMTAKKRTTIVEQTRGPLEALANSGPKSSAEKQEVAEAAVTRGLQGLADDLVAVAHGTESLGGAISNFVASLGEDLLRSVIQDGITAPLATAMQGFIQSAFNLGPTITKASADSSAALATTALASATVVTTTNLAAMAAAAVAAASALAAVAASSAASGAASLLSAAGSAAGAAGGVPIPRAGGGRVMPGQDYLVGERKAEVVRFDSPGTVYPNGAPPGQAQAPVNLSPRIEVHNNLGVQARATVERTNDGGMKVNLEKVGEQMIDGAGRSGKLKKALGMSPAPKRRG